MADANQVIDCRLLLIGNASVGKSSLLLRFTDKTWLPEDEASATIVVDFRLHKMEINGKKVKLSIWDTAGSERFRAVTPAYYRGAQGVILVYDVTDRRSFEALPQWYSELESHVSKSAVKIVVGNKVDKGARQISTTEGEAFAFSMNSLFIETSAKTAIGVSEAFEEVAKKIINTPELWAPATSPPAGDSTGGNIASAFEDFMSGNVSLYPRKPESQSGGCRC